MNIIFTVATYYPKTDRVQLVKQYKAEGLDKIIYLADKKSRSCFLCNAEKLCKWSKEKKNLDIII